MAKLSPTLVVMAAGMSTRFGRLKQLEPLGPSGEALLDYALFDAARAGFSRFVLVIRPELQSEFERHLAPAVKAGLVIDYAHQLLTDPELLPEAVPGRERPWGTGFAVLASRHHLASSFAVCNADDFYGRRAYAALHRALAADPSSAVLIGYELSRTLSRSGSVSRAACQRSDEGFLHDIRELVDLVEGDGVAVGRDVSGEAATVDLDTPVSMNLWGFPGAAVPLLAERFRSFLSNGPDKRDEFYLSEAVQDLIALDQLKCRVVPTDEDWLGVTHPDDAVGVARSLAALVDSGVYPSALWDSSPDMVERS